MDIVPPTARRPAQTRTTATIPTVPDVTGDTGWATFSSRVATDVVRCVDLDVEPEALSSGMWFVVAEFEGRARAWQFRDVSDSLRPPSSPWTGPEPDSWTSSMDRHAYEAAVTRIREHVRDGDVYQANLCRVLSAPLPATSTSEPSAAALAARLAAGNPAPHAAAIHVPAGLSTTGSGPGSRSAIDPVWVVSASPELYLSLEPGPDGPVITSGPIKGTARTPDGLSAKDRAENVMITDLVRNDLQHVCRPGTVEVSGLLSVEHHPGLVHLVSHVRGVLTDDVARDPARWRHLMSATFPPGSVSGAPKSSALRIIETLESAPRGPYCGAIGWVDGDAGTASLSVGIRTFWWDRLSDDGAGVLRFGTGAGITWDSDPAGEWAETELKAERLVGLASSGAEPTERFRG